MIQWTHVRRGTLNGTGYEFAVTRHNGCPRTAYAYFWWGSELLFFHTGTETMVDGEAIIYKSAAQVATQSSAALSGSRDGDPRIR